MRVGLVAKGLLLKGDLDLELVLLCKEKPTTALLDKVADNLAVQLTAVTDDKYEILQSVDDAAIVIKNTKEPPLSLTIHLTSPVVREEMEKVLAGETLSVNDPPDVLDRQKCLAALASLRHAKWFQVCILFFYLSFGREFLSFNLANFHHKVVVTLKSAVLNLAPAGVRMLKERA